MAIRPLYLSDEQVRGILAGEVTGVVEPVRCPAIIPGDIAIKTYDAGNGTVAFLSGDIAQHTFASRNSYMWVREPHACHYVDEKQKRHLVFKADYNDGLFPDWWDKHDSWKPGPFLRMGEHRLEVRIESVDLMPISRLTEEMADGLITFEDTCRPTMRDLLPYSSAYKAPYDSSKVIFLWNWALRNGKNILEIDPWIWYVKFSDYTVKSMGAKVKKKAGEKYEGN